MKNFFQILLIFSCFHAGAQMEINNNYPIRELVEVKLAGDGVRILNIDYEGNSKSIAYFQDQSTFFPSQEGILLTTGNPKMVSGPNKGKRTGSSAGTPGDDDLTSISNHSTYDAAILEFDFITEHEYISFFYTFGSEEYNEFVGSAFNDVFAFFISGPDIPGRVNLAVLPNTVTPVTVNTINFKENANYYIDNDIQDLSNKNTIEYDGFTKILTAQAKVIPGKTYHIKIAIADVADRILDSGVFLEANSFSSHTEMVPFLKEDHVKIQSEASLDTVETGMISKTKVKINEPWNITIEFDFDSDILKSKFRRVLDEVCDSTLRMPNCRVQLYGHTDSVGSQSYNKDLSRRRAEGVRNYLEEKGFDAKDVQMEWYGKKKPLVSDSTEEGRARNRRVEIIFIKEGD